MYDIHDNDGNLLTGLIDTHDNMSKKDSSKNPEDLTISYIITQLEKIRADSGYIYEALSQIKNLESHPPTLNTEDVATQAKAHAIGSIVKQREETNQKLLKMYEKMYDDLNPKPMDLNRHRQESLKALSDMWAINSEGLSDYIPDIIKELMK